MVAEVLATPRTEQQIDGLSRRNAGVFDQFLNELAGSGCRALAYRLSGQEPVNHLCVRHLGGSLRVIVAFETPRRAWILLIGPHDDQDPVLNVYAELYRLLGCCYAIGRSPKAAPMSAWPSCGPWPLAGQTPRKRRHGWESSRPRTGSRRYTRRLCALWRPAGKTSRLSLPAARGGWPSDLATAALLRDRATADEHEIVCLAAVREPIAGWLMTRSQSRCCGHSPPPPRPLRRASRSAGDQRVAVGRPLIARERPRGSNLAPAADKACSRAGRFVRAAGAKIV